MSSSNTQPMINRVLRLVRVYHDLSQAELARRLGLSKSYISEIESGRKKVSLDLLRLYSSEFKIPVSSLLLFEEHAGEKPSRDARSYVAEKVVKMLDWIAAVTAEDNTDSEIEQ